MDPIEFIRPADQTWSAILDEALGYDFYHLPGYHEMAEARGEGRALLCASREGDYTIALPLLLRPIKDVPGLEDCAAVDATSVYGYPGPIVSRPPPLSVIQGFQVALTRALEEHNVVSVFSRLHPLLPQADCLQGLGRLEPAGVTLAIDLRLPIEEQRARYRRNHKHGINKLQRIGVECFVDTELRYLDDFTGLYRDTMERVDATSYYFFDRAYFEQLRAALGQSLHLYVCRHADEIICGGLFVHTNDIVQYHLGGTHDRYLKWAPMKLLFDKVRQDFSGHGAAWFHLGGGLGARRDSLFHFKSGFGGEEVPFMVWKWVVQEAAYEELCRQRLGPDRDALSGFFPEYRT